MKEPNRLVLTFVSAIIILAGTLTGIFLYMNPSDDMLYCERNKPEWNNSIDNTDRDSKCYNELWPQYCKIRSPYNCPEIEQRIAKAPKSNLSVWPLALRS